MISDRVSGGSSSGMRFLAVSIGLGLVEEGAGVLVVRFRRFALAALQLGGVQLGGLGSVGFEEVSARLVGAGFVDGEVGFDFVLEAKLPGVGLSGVQLPE